MIEILPMQAGHLPEVRRLAEQLGYVSGLSEFTKRFEDLLTQKDHKLLVAVDGSHVVGWIHLSYIRNLLKENRVEIKALVVDENRRSQGIGKKLIEETKSWCRKNKLKKIFLRTNIKRANAHRFYEREGFVKAKTSHIYELGIEI